MLTPEWIGLLIVVLSQLVLFIVTFQSLRERVKVLEEKAEKAVDSHDAVISIKTKLDLLYNLYLEQYNKK